MKSLFTLTVFTSAFLLLLIQPMMAKLLLPQVGGAPSVWVAAMLFFQMVLLAGYGYASVTTYYLSPRKQWWLHGAVFLLAIGISLPLQLQVPESIDATQSPVSWVLLTLLASIGLPYFVLTASSSLLQRWYYSCTQQEPYFLFSASNAGSLLGLLAYPLMIEWLFGVGDQLLFFGAAFTLLLLFFIAVYAGVLRGKPLAEHPAEKTKPDLNLGWKLTAKTIVLAFLPSALFLALTLYLTTDIASLPLIWVIPLGLYLLSFVVVFAPWGAPWIAAAQKLHPLVILAFILTLPGFGAIPVMISHFLLFFVVALSCHGQMARYRPQPSKLTIYFFWVSVGGVLGGLCNVLMPFLLNDTFEYVVLMLLSLLILPAKHSVLDGLRKLKDFGGLRLLAGVGGAAAILLLVWLPSDEEAYQSANETLLYQSRNFYGVSRISRMESKEHEVAYNRYLHGTTNHGFQILNSPHTLKPVSYYSPIARLLAELPVSYFQQPFAVMGLGSGTLACYGRTGQEVDFFEIDEEVIRIASNPELFTYLRDCPPNTKVIQGDARIKIAALPADRKYNLLVMDAFSSDAIPLHLVTKEAIALYQTHAVDQTGVIAVHVSNRYFKLVPFVTRIAQELGWKTYYQKTANKKVAFPEVASEWIVLVPKTSPWQPMLTKTGFSEFSVDSDTPLWTDDYSHLLLALRDKALSIKELF